MSTITFDTHKFVKDLESAGVPPAQAEAFVRAQQEILSQSLDTTLATKSDIAVLDLKIDKLSWMMGILIALAIANFAKQFF
ncbi:MAG: coiled-coil domain-containing protein [Sulfuritalea sp.]|nr:coiled-coil domain-containing protein [Sulfuritalea sp.]